MWCVVSTHALFLLDISRQLGPKQFRGLKSLPGQQLLEQVYVRAVSVTLLQRQPAEFPSCHRFASSFIYSITHHSYIKKNFIVTKKSLKNFAKKKNYGWEEGRGWEERKLWAKKTCPTDIHIKQNFFRKNKEGISPLKSILFRGAWIPAFCYVNNVFSVVSVKITQSCKGGWAGQTQSHFSAKVINYLLF